MPRTGFSEQLQDLLLETDVLDDFLRELSAVFADFASAQTGRPVLCSARVVRPRQAETFGASDDEALALDKVQDDIGDGPGLEALRTGRSVMVPDASLDPRWRRYLRTAARRGIRSILAVCVLAEPGAGAAMTVFSPRPEAFDDDAVAACADLTARAGRAMSLAIRLEAAQNLNRDLLQATRSRTAINLATGILMAQSHCSQSEAFDLLTRVSNTRNIKLRIVAEEIIQRFEGGTGGTAFSA